MKWFLIAIVFYAPSAATSYAVGPFGSLSECRAVERQIRFHEAEMRGRDPDTNCVSGARK